MSAMESGRPTNRHVERMVIEMNAHYSPLRAILNGYVELQSGTYAWAVISLANSRLMTVQSPVQ